MIFTQTVDALWSLKWRHKERDGVSNHRRLDCLFSRLLKRRSKKTSKAPRHLCEGNPPVTGGFPSQRARNAENVSIWWRHHGICTSEIYFTHPIHTECNFLFTFLKVKVWKISVIENLVTFPGIMSWSNAIIVYSGYGHVQFRKDPGHHMIPRPN